MIYKLSETNPTMYEGQVSITNRPTAQASGAHQANPSSYSRQVKIQLKMLLIQSEHSGVV